MIFISSRKIPVAVGIRIILNVEITCVPSTSATVAEWLRRSPAKRVPKGASVRISSVALLLFVFLFSFLNALGVGAFAWSLLLLSDCFERSLLGQKLQGLD